VSAETEFAIERKSAGDDGAGCAIALSVIIPSFNTRELLANCLQSIYRNPPGEPFEIIVVDDASTDGTSEMVRARFPGVRLLRNEINRHDAFSYAFSNNRAIDQARGQFLLLLNSDTVVLPEALDSMLAFLRMHPEAGAVGCRLLNEDGTIQWSVKSLPNLGSALFGARSFMSRLFPNNRFTRKHLLHLGRDMTTPFVATDGYVSSASLMASRKAVDAVGYLDTRLAYHVDADYCKRMADAGYQCWYLPAATMVHLNHKGGTTASTRARFRSLVMFEVHSHIYYRKHLQRPVWSPMRILVPLGLFAHFLILVAAQACAEFAGVMRSLSQPKKSSAP
jgi:GT2 family glycosyltransferase